MFNVIFLRSLVFTLSLLSLPVITSYVAWKLTFGKKD